MLTSKSSVSCNRRSRTVGWACLAAKQKGSNLKLMSSYQPPSKEEVFRSKATYSIVSWPLVRKSYESLLSF